MLTWRGCAGCWGRSTRLKSDSPDKNQPFPISSPVIVLNPSSIPFSQLKNAPADDSTWLALHLCSCYAAPLFLPALCHRGSVSAGLSKHDACVPWQTVLFACMITTFTPTWAVHKNQNVFHTFIYPHNSVSHNTFVCEQEWAGWKTSSFFYGWLIYLCWKLLWSKHPCEYLFVD